MNFSYHLPLWHSVVLFIDYLSKTAIQIICKSIPGCLWKNRKTKIGNWRLFAKVAHFTYMPLSCNLLDQFRCMNLL